MIRLIVRLILLLRVNAVFREMMMLLLLAKWFLSLLDPDQQIVDIFSEIKATEAITKCIRDFKDIEIASRDDSLTRLSEMFSHILFDDYKYSYGIPSKRRAVSELETHKKRLRSRTPILK